MPNRPPPVEWTVPQSPPKPHKPDFQPIFVNGEITLHEWAKRAKVPESTLNLWWHGHRHPGKRSATAIARLGEVLGIDRWECLKMLLECGELNRLHRMLGTPQREIKSWSAPPVPRGFRRVPGKYGEGSIVPVTAAWRKLSQYRKKMRARVKARRAAAAARTNTDPTP